VSVIRQTGDQAKTILIADDEPNIRLLVRRTFEPEYVVLEAVDGRQAIDMAISDHPDIILMDVMMPRVDGLTALNTIKGNQNTAAIPVIMITGLGFKLNEQLAGNLGAAAYLRKPVAPRELSDTVKSLI
jgi:CheY-like chemotaxis protein